MANKLDELDRRMSKIRTGWSGNDPAPGSAAFGQRAQARQQRLREAAYENKFPVAQPASGVGHVDTSESEMEEEVGATPKVKAYQQKDVLKEAGE